MKNKSQDLGVGIEDLGIKSQAVGLGIPATSGLQNPKSKIQNPAFLNPDFLKRVQWRSRRGLLELDIFLQPFVAQQYASLGEAELLAFDALLDLPDNTLWDMMTGREINEDAVQSALLEKIKTV